MGPMLCPSCGTEDQIGARLCEKCGWVLRPEMPPPPPPGADAANATIKTLIPYGNPHAPIAYYLGLFAFIPFLGILLGIPAFILGIKGLSYSRLHPEARGRTHAWVGVILGGF